MRVLLAMLLLVSMRASAAQDIHWLASEQLTTSGSIIHLGASAEDGLDVAGALRNGEWTYGRWQAEQISGGLLARALDSQLPLQRARLVLIAEPEQAEAALTLAAEMSGNPDGRNLLRGLVLRVEGAVAWPPSAKRAAIWPSLYIGFAPTTSARNAAFQLASRARRAGASVMLRPLAEQTGTTAMPQLGNWLGTLDLPRAQSFEDATVRAPERQPLDRDLDQLDRLAELTSAAHADQGMWVAGESSSQPVRLQALGGRIFREGPTLTKVLEFDARAALSEIYGSTLERVEFATASTSLRHPEVGVDVLAVPVYLQVSGQPRSILLLRRADASYGFLDLQDARRVEAMIASSDVRDGGRIWWLRMAGADPEGKRLLQLGLERASPRRGMWWDPDHPGHGIDLQPVAGGHSLVFATYDEAGASRWYLASGRIVDGKFRTGTDGLLLMRRENELSPPKADSRLAGRVEIDFTAGATHVRCAERGGTATQRALFTVTRNGVTEQWCIEPMPLPAGVPEQDVNGAWYGGGSDSGWGLSVVSAGIGQQALLSAILYYHDRDGWPRWALGGSPRGDSGAALSLFDYTLECPACKSVRPSAREVGELLLRTAGWCGAPELRASINIASDRGDVRFLRQEMSLQQISQKRCY